jgi:hypothetical protein
MFPRTIIITDDFGAGLSTWWDTESKYDIIEHPALIKAYKNGASADEAQQALIDAGFPENVITNLYWGGWESASERAVYGPYIVTEYDGKESIMHQKDVTWRT